MSLTSGSLPVTQILMQHIRAILPDLKLCISTQMIMLQKALTSYMGSSLISRWTAFLFFVFFMLVLYAYGVSSQRVWSCMERQKDPCWWWYGLLMGENAVVLFRAIVRSKEHCCSASLPNTLMVKDAISCSGNNILHKCIFHCGVIFV
jgi:hypothetical protein